MQVITKTNQNHRVGTVARFITLVIALLKAISVPIVARSVIGKGTVQVRKSRGDLRANGGSSR